MITSESTLTDVCFAVSTALDHHGMPAVLTGGSAAAVFAPHADMSDDADFILTHDDSLGDVAVALQSIGFQRDGRSRMFVHLHTRFTVDFPKGPLSVGGDYLQETHVLERGDLRLRILTRIDCIRDRLAHFYFWNDYTALNAAVGVAADASADLDLSPVQAWTERESPLLLEKYAEFERRLQQARKLF